MDPGSRKPQVTTVTYPITEYTAASLFIARYKNAIIRLDDDEGGPPLFIAPHRIHDEHGDLLPNPMRGGPLTYAFMLEKITAFVNELVADADQITRIRCQSHKFAKGVLAYLKHDARMRPPMRRTPSNEEDDPRHLDACIEARRACRDEALGRRERVRA